MKRLRNLEHETRAAKTEELDEDFRQTAEGALRLIMEESGMLRNGRRLSDSSITSASPSPPPPIGRGSAKSVSVGGNATRHVSFSSEEGGVGGAGGGRQSRNGDSPPSPGRMERADSAARAELFAHLDLISSEIQKEAEEEVWG